MTLRPGRHGLYDPSFEHDACGVAFVARLDATPLHETVSRALEALENLEHRGAAGADPDTGDGAGILLQLPDEFLRDVIGDGLPAAGRYGVAMCFLPPDEARREPSSSSYSHRSSSRRVRASSAGVTCPSTRSTSGAPPPLTAPVVRQLVVAAGSAARRRPGRVRAEALRDPAPVSSSQRAPMLVVPSFSSRTIVYKGMLTAPQLRGYFPDLRDPRTASALALVHSRFSTNTFPSWELAHPVPDDRAQRRDQHRARQRQLDARARVAARVRALR